MVVYNWLPIRYLLKNGLEVLTKESWEDSWENNGCLKYNPDWEEYKKKEDRGEMRILAAMDGKELIGYACVILIRELLDKDKFSAVIQAFYMKKSKRKGMLGFKFLKFLENQLRLIKADRVIIAHRFKKDNRESLLFKRLKYVHQENLMVKNLSGA